MIAPAGAGSELGAYRIEGPLPGTTGARFRARDVNDGRIVTLQILGAELESPDALAQRLAEDTRRVNALGHPHVAAVHGAGVEAGVAFVAFQPAAGLDLAVLADRLGGLRFERTARLLGQVGDALDAVHAAGLVHGSLEASRVLVASGDEGDHALVAGFALAPALEAYDRDGNVPVGLVPGYAAPERISGEAATPAADVYALACVYFKALTGRAPFEGAAAEQVLEAHLSERPPLVRDAAPELPPALQEVLERGLATDPRDRFESAGELARAALDAPNRPDPELEREAERRRVIAGWQRSIAAGAAGWSPENPVLASADEVGESVTAADTAVTEPPETTPPPATPTPGAGSSAPRPARAKRGDDRSLARRIRGPALGVALAGAVAVGILLVVGGGETDDGDATRTPAQSQSQRGDDAGGVAVTDWPARDGYTAIISVSPIAGDGAEARARARAAARLGYRSGVLDSSDFASLQPRLRVAFAGVYDTRAEAERAAAQLQSQGVVAAPYVRFVERAG